MTKPIGERMPHEVLEAFDGTDLEHKIGPAFVLVTVDPEGTPRPCMLSAGEILAVDDRHLRLALWPGTKTSRNLAAGSPALLCFVAPGTTLYLRGAPRSLGRSDAPRVERFELEVDSVEADDHPGMPVSSPITFSVSSADPSSVAESWRKQIAVLRD